MGASRSSRGQTLGALGAAGLVASLWLPWYTIQVSHSADVARQLGPLGSLITSGLRLGATHFTAWQIFNTTPSVLLVAAIIGGGLAALAVTHAAGNSSQLTILAGAVAAVLVGYRVAVPPGHGGFVHPAWGIYLAFASALAMVAGGGLARGEDDQPFADWPSVAAASSLSAAQSPRP